MAGPGAVGPDCESGRCPKGKTGVGYAAGQRVRGENPHGAPEHLVGTLCELSSLGLALPEGLESGEALKGVEKVGREAGVCPLATQAVRGVPSVEGARREQGDDRKAEQHRSHRKVEEGNETKDDERRDRSHEQLR